MIVLAGLYLAGYDSFKGVSPVLQLPVNDREQHGRSPAGHRLTEAFFGMDLAVFPVDGCFLGSCRPRCHRRVFHLDVRALSNEFIGDFLVRLLAHGGLFAEEFLALRLQFLTAF